MDHLNGSGDASPIGEFFQLGLSSINNYLMANLRVMPFIESMFTHNNVVSGLKGDSSFNRYLLFSDVDLSYLRKTIYLKPQEPCEVPSRSW